MTFSFSTKKTGKFEVVLILFVNFVYGNWLTNIYLTKLETFRKTGCFLTTLRFKNDNRQIIS